MKKSVLRKILIAVLTAVFLVSGGFALHTFLQYEAEKTASKAVQEQFVTVEQPVIPSSVEPTLVETPEEETKKVEPETSPEPEIVLENPGITVDFSSLLAVNDDICGWLYLPNTDISYPVLQGETNNTYLHTNYEGKYAYAGCIFLDYRSAADFSQKNTIIYGHNMKSNIMFSNLDKYKNPDFVAENPNFFLLTPDGYRQYEVCQVLETEATSAVYGMTFDTDAEFQIHLDFLNQLALFPIDVDVTMEDQILTLSTCADQGEYQRLVVVGRLVGKSE